MKIFITGGTGFIGKSVVGRLLKTGDKLLILTLKSADSPILWRKNKKIQFIKGDLSKIEIWKSKVNKFKPDAVIHLAWEGLGTNDYSTKTSLKNLRYGLNTISLAAEMKCKKFLSLGSSWEYGENKGKLSESDKLKTPVHVPSFVLAKRTLESLGKQIALENKMQFFWARVFFAYGPGQKPTSLLPHLITNFKAELKPKIKNRTGGNDFVYIDDVADAIVKILKNCKKTTTIYNIGAGYLTSVAHITNLTAKYFKKPATLKEPKKVNGFYADISKISREIGWRPKTNIKDGVKKTIEYLKTQ